MGSSGSHLMFANVAVIASAISAEGTGPDGFVCLSKASTRPNAEIEARMRKAGTRQNRPVCGYKMTVVWTASLKPVRARSCGPRWSTSQIFGAFQACLPTMTTPPILGRDQGSAANASDNAKGRLSAAVSPNVEERGSLEPPFFLFNHWAVNALATKPSTWTLSPRSLATSRSGLGSADQLVALNRRLCQVIVGQMPILLLTYRSSGSSYL